MAAYRRYRKQSRVEEFDKLIKNLIMDQDLPPAPVPPPPPPSRENFISDNETPNMGDPDTPPPPPPAIIDDLDFDVDFDDIIGTSEMNNNKESMMESVDDNAGESGSEEDFDFTDADAAIDAMLDDLQNFQNELGPDSLKDKRDEFGMLSPVKTKLDPPEIEDLEVKESANCKQSADTDCLQL